MDFVNKLLFLIGGDISDFELFRNYMSTVRDMRELLFQLYEHLVKVLYDLVFIEVASQNRRKE